MKRTIELGYRVYARQASDTEGLVDKTIYALGNVAIDCLAIDPDRGLSWREVDDLFIPIKPERLPEAKERGLLITEYRGRQCLAVRETAFTVGMEPGDNPEEWVAAILEQVGNVFATVRIVTEYLTEVQAV
jgi:hypothetical protein